MRALKACILGVAVLTHACALSRMRVELKEDETGGITNRAGASGTIGDGGRSAVFSASAGGQNALGGTLNLVGSGATSYAPGTGDSAAAGTRNGANSGGVPNTGSFPDAGGAAAGGIGTGRVLTSGGGIGTGGVASDGVATGGVATGGVASGGVATGGMGTGGVATGGTTANSSSHTGGTAIGGAATGTGGSSAAVKFSFFVISYNAILLKAGSSEGFGGDLRYGTGDGLTGADKICTEVAETSLPNNGKIWRAYLSTSTVDAIARIGNGPWYDRKGRLVALSVSGLLRARPADADPVIINDLPNEDGIPNHAPDGTEVDNHNVLTGTNSQGALYSASANCLNWTSSEITSAQRPRVGHSWLQGTPPAGNAEGASHWASALIESGCGAGVNIAGGSGTNGTVGSTGGYGAWYCFATSP